jgi:K+-sensing histidine kinase KdpD
MLNEHAEVEARLIAEVIRLAPRFAASAIASKHRKGWMSRAAPYLIAVVMVQLALAFTQWYRPLAGDGIPSLYAFSLAVLAATWIGGRRLGLFCASLSLIMAKLFFFPPLFQITIEAGSRNRLFGITVGIIAIAMARSSFFDNHGRRRLRRIKEAIRNTRSSSTAWPRFSSLIRNS